MTTTTTMAATAAQAAGKKPAPRRKRASKARPLRAGFAAGADGERQFLAATAAWERQRAQNRASVAKTRAKQAAAGLATTAKLEQLALENARLRAAVLAAEAALERRDAARAELARRMELGAGGAVDVGDVFGEVVYAGDPEAATQTIDLAIDADPEIAALFATLPEL